ncbi:hypothetical protein ACSRO5_000648, partial [Escherichia coli]
FHSFQFLYRSTSRGLARTGGIVCKKSRLKIFSDMKTAGGCGVVPFWSVERIFSFFTIAAYQNECADIRPCQTVNRGA